MSSTTDSLTTGTTRLFAERTASAELEKHLDRHGFLQPSAQFFTFDNLLKEQCSLVLAPPWIGKTFTARRIEGSLKERPKSPPADQPEFHERTDFEEYLPSRPLEPGWWKEWEDSQLRATWIIDALDEGQRQQPTLWPALRSLLNKLSDEKRARLCLLVFAREGDLRAVAPEFESELREIFRDGFSAVNLLPLDVRNARDVLATKGHGTEVWERVINLIDRNQLQAVAGYPATLLFLAQQSSEAELTVEDVWKGTLAQLLEEHHYKARHFRAELELRFAASARIAAVLTLMGQEELAEPPLTYNKPNLYEVFPVPEPSYIRATRAAAREALRSGMFRPTPEGYRFLHKNVREWMAAFGMASLPIAKLRPVVQFQPASLNAP